MRPLGMIRYYFPISFFMPRIRFPLKISTTPSAIAGENAPCEAAESLYTGVEINISFIIIYAVSFLSVLSLLLSTNPAIPITRLARKLVKAISSKEFFVVKLPLLKLGRTLSYFLPIRVSYCSNGTPPVVGL